MDYFPQQSGFQMPYMPQNQFNAFPGRNPQNGINWVQGLEGAKCFQLMPNSNAVLLDKENDGILYIKTCDNVGMCNLRTFNYTEITMQEPQTPPVAARQDMANYVSREEFNELKAMIEERGGYNGKQSVQSNDGKSNHNNR